MTKNLDGPLIAQWARRAAAGLRERQAEINSLNVFPIPDSDTGSNMAHTMTQAVAFTRDSDESDTSTLTAALASGAVRGARGNSGMVLSQVLRALADTAAHGPVDGTAVAQMLSKSVDFVKHSIASPVEGTILTVLRAAAEGAHQGRNSLIETVQRALDAAERALEQTPKQLDVLAKAGVVDAGGCGLVVILQALLDTLTHEDRHREPNREARVGASQRMKENCAEPHAEEGVNADSIYHDSFAAPDAFPDTDGSDATMMDTAPSMEIEVMFMFDATGKPHAIRELRDFLDNAGNSVVIAHAGDSVVKVHVHTRRAGAVIEKAFSLARVFDLRLEVLPGSELPQTPIIALAPSGGAADVFEGAGAIAVDLDKADDREINDLLDMASMGMAIVLTNGRDASAFMDRGRPVAVLDTRSLVGGLAALAVHDPHNDFDDDLEEMVDAVSIQRCVETTAETMAEDLDALLTEGGELVTLLWSSPEVSDAQIEQLRARVAQQYPDVELHDYRADGMGAAVEIGVE
ncbi:DAK2 domain-containing protein [Corynebacterium sp. 4HC-13]|uniref:DAK2 domain-containing protein n=1 Tax=Corynebacterium anserum TaxID=2684406 RepID=UPI00163ACAF3|nr:DAK2 domain-containing protein [Corynebacterium anserum]MBC2681805.1 DAK2 domain-containing protein [Corynebacterium anserum]